ncbi:MAG: 1-deoxy-D-xylulose-5-phosphate synthase [Candidatus Sumerlaeia bacterium]
MSDVLTSPLFDRVNVPADIKGFTIPELTQLCSELRRHILEQVSRRGGHLASPLGAVELIVALLHLYDVPRDKIVWDVGHQTYAWKLLTGRKHLFSTLRQYKGLSGFLKMSESQYDAFGAGHASTSIAAALGFALARDRRGESHRVVAVIGDGAMTGGLAYEALNNAGHLDTDMLVILNDNDVSISKNVWAVQKLFNRLITDPFYNQHRQEVEKLLEKIHFGKLMLKAAHRVEGSIKGLFVPGMFFEQLGFRYIGPIDGHDLNSLVPTLKKVRDLRGPILLHCLTQKGKGYSYSEEDPTKYHGANKLEIKTGSLGPSAAPSYTTVFATALIREAERDQRLIGITAAMATGTGLDKFAEKFPDRFFDMGIAEGCAVTAAAAMAAGGLRPVCAIYSTFLQRAFDHIIHDVALQKLPVVFAMDRGGLVGADGPTHHGAFDLSWLRLIPNMTLGVPKDANELCDMLATAVRHEGGPFAFRYPRGTAVGWDPQHRQQPLPIGRGEVLREGSDVCFLAVGVFVHYALEAARILEDEWDVSASVYNMRWVKPLDRALLRRAVEGHRLLIALEDNTMIGGFASALNEEIANMQMERLSGHGDAADGDPAGAGVRLVCPMGLPDRFIEHGEVAELHGELQLLPGDIVRRTLALLGIRPAPIHEAMTQPAP